MIPASLAAGASAVVTITGTEQSMPINLDTTVPDGCVPVVTTTAQYATCYDTGGGYLVILTYDASTGGFLSQSQYSFNYGVGDTAATISDRLAAAINADPAARLVATAVPGAPANQGMINVQLASASSTAVVYNVVAGFGCGDDFNSCSFSIDVPTQLTASQTSCKIPAVYDAGTVSVTVNNGPVASYTWTRTDTAATVASGLASAVNTVYGGAGMNLVNASAPAGSTVVQLASIGVGPTTNYPVATTVSFNSADFQSSSFTTVAAGMAGGLLSTNGTSAGSTQYVYSPSGAKIAVLQGGQLVKGTVPLPGGATAVYNASGFGYFRHKDWLGSSRLATNWDHTVYSKEAYAPFGETENNMEQTSSSGQADRSFTGEDQDTTSGIFDYLFRRYDPVAGRWLSPDPSGWGSVSPEYPQSLNRYAYVQNDPMQLTDPDGLDCVYFSTGGGISNISLGECDPTVPGGHHVNGTFLSAIATPGDASTNSPYVYSVAYDKPGDAPGSNISVAVFDGPAAGTSQNQSGTQNQPDAPSNEHKNPFLCGSEAAGKISLAGGLSHIPGLGSGVGGFIVNAVGGNAFSGATDLIHSVANGEGGGHSVFYNMGQSVIAGPTQGFGAAFGGSIGKAIESSPWGADIVSVGLKALPLVGEYASGIGEAKLIYDGVTYFGATAGCALGIVH